MVFNYKFWCVRFKKIFIWMMFNYYFVVVVVNYDYVLWYLRMEFEIVMLIIFDKYRFGKYKKEKIIF